jgi:hypothetical protein
LADPSYSWLLLTQSTSWCKSCEQRNGNPFPAFDVSDKKCRWRPEDAFYGIKIKKFWQLFDIHYKFILLKIWAEWIHEFIWFHFIPGKFCYWINIVIAVWYESKSKKSLFLVS